MPSVHQTNLLSFIPEAPARSLPARQPDNNSSSLLCPRGGPSRLSSSQIWCKQQQPGPARLQEAGGPGGRTQNGMSIHRESRPALHQEGKRSFLSPAKLGTIFMASSGPRYKSSSLTLKMHVLFIKIYAFLPFLCAAESESLTSDTSLRHTIKGPLLWKSPPKEGEGDTLQFFPEPPPPPPFLLLPSWTAPIAPSGLFEKKKRASVGRKTETFFDCEHFVRSTSVLVCVFESDDARLCRCRKVNSKVPPPLLPLSSWWAELFLCRERRMAWKLFQLISNSKQQQIANIHHQKVEKASFSRAVGKVLRRGLFLHFGIKEKFVILVSGLCFSGFESNFVQLTNNK